MPSPYFGGAPNAWAGGQEYAIHQQQRQQQQNALNALIQRFGPEAANPQALASLQGSQQDAQMFPHQLGAAERATAGQAAVAERHGPIAADPTAAGLNNDANAQIRQTALNGAIFAESVVRRGGTPVAAFDQVEPILAAMNMPVEHLQQLRQQVEQNPASLQDIIAMLRNDGSGGAARAVGAPIPVYQDGSRQPRLLQYMTDGTSHIVPGVSPAATVLGEDRANIARANVAMRGRALTNEEARMEGFSAPPGHQIWRGEDGIISARPLEGSGQELEREGTVDERIAKARGLVAGVGNVVRAGTTVVRDTEDALEMMNDRRMSGGMLGAAERWAQTSTPGTYWWNVQQLIESIKSNIGVDAVLNIKREGATLGQVPDRQLVRLQQILGNLDVRRDPELIKRDLEDVLEMYTTIVKGGRADLIRVNGEIEQWQGQRPRNTPRPPAPASAAPRPSGERTIDEIMAEYPGTRSR